MIYCSNCGTANRDGSSFCNECGTKLPASGSIKCPMCSTLNPSGKVFCDNCGARLVPALAEPDAPDHSTPLRRGISLPSKSDVSGSKGGPVENVPDWMRDASSEEQPDWLQRLAGNSTGAADDQSAAEPAASADLPDWMSNLSASVPAETPIQPASIEPPTTSTTSADQVAAEDVPDWMSNLRATAPSLDDTQPSAPQSAETPDWPRNLSAGAPAVTEPPAVRNVANDIPEWLSKLAGNAPTVPMTPIKSDLPASGTAPVDKTESADIPDDWLSRLVKPAPTVPEPTPAPAPEGEPPAEESSASDSDASLDWLTRLADGSMTMPEESPTDSLPAAELSAPNMPDWLKEFGGTLTSESTNTTDVPDWLGNLAASMPAESSAPNTSAGVPEGLKDEDRPAVLGEEPSEISDVPDWLREFQATGEPATSTAQPAFSIEEPAAAEPVAESVAATPDWLAALQPAPPMHAEEEAQSFEPAAEPMTETPDWLAALQAAPPMQAEEEAQSIEPAAEPMTETPDWLAALQAAPPMQAEEARSVPIEKAVEPKVKIEKPIQPIRIEPPAPIAAKPIEAAQPTAETEMPQWLRGMSQASAAPAPHGPIAPIPPELPPELREEPAVAADLPDWLQALRKGAPAGGTLASSGIAQGEIPEWLEALRPQIGETQLIDEGPEAETEGVLAGLAQTLPSVPLMGEVHGTPASLKVETSAQDLARAGMFQELLARGASTPKPVVGLPGRGAKMRRRVGQWLIALAVLVSMGIPAKMDLNKALSFQLLPHLDKLPTTAVRLAFKTIDQLPDGSTALVIFDYDPTQSGEMNPIADVLLRHLIARGTAVQAASLNPLGSSVAQAEWLKASSQLSDTVQFENLGYVAGQSIGVQQLLERNPSIGLVVDLAASPDNLRWWVEQIAASNLQVPLIAGLSAGAEPLALPYIRSGQVKGTVVGLVGALAYAQYTGLSPLSTASQATENQIHLEAQTLAHWMLVLIILIGMLSALFSRGGRRSAA